MSHKKTSIVDAALLGQVTSVSDLQSLEPRILLDAAGYATATDVVDQMQEDVSNHAVQEAISGNAAAPWAADRTLSEQALYAGVDDGGQAREIAFIDSAVEDYEALVASFDDSVEIIVLDGDRDGVEQIAEVLAERSNVEALHIVSHGRSGTLDLGTAKLTEASMNGRHGDEMAIIRDALSADADILIYGCDFGAHARGVSAVQALAELTSADVAASNDLTGAAHLGGDWDLEVVSGAVETRHVEARNFDGTLATTVINAAGGSQTDGSDGLSIYVVANGQLQVEFKGANQVYEPSVTDDSAHLFNGVYLAVGNTVTGGFTDSALTGPYSGPANGPGIAITDQVFVEAGQTVTGSGSGTDPIIVTTTLFYDAGGATGVYNPATDFQVEITTSYVVPNPYFTQSVTITPPAGNTDPVKFYHALDTFLNINVPAGSNPDAGPGFTLDQAPGNPSVVGVARDADNDGTIDSFTAFAEEQGGEEFDQYYTAVYNGPGLYANGINNGGDIVNTVDPNPATDNGLGIQFNLDDPGTAQTFTYHVAFRGEATIDLDADDSSGVVGSGYSTTYELGQPDPVRIVDTDVAIQNVVGDIQEVRIALTNPQTGDQLTVNTAGLPANVSVQSQTATEIILEASGGFALAESTFDAALLEVGFQTSSTSLAQRNFDFAITNELGEEGRASAGSIAVVLLDNDGDGINDYDDVDDDNDGVLDVTEGFVADGTGGAFVFYGYFGVVGQFGAGPYDVSFDVDGQTETATVADLNEFVQFLNDVDPDGLNWTADPTVSAVRRDSIPTSDFVQSFADLDAIFDNITVIHTGSGATAGLAPNFTGEVLSEQSRDSDQDGIADHHDIDSDNDGIVDIIEAQATDSYIAPSGTGTGITDINQDGLDDSFDSRSTTNGGAGLTVGSTAATSAEAIIVPVNTDGVIPTGVTAISDDVADYLDSDSDGDGVDDGAENGLAAGIQTGLSTSATDADGDGLFDVFENAIDGNASDGFVSNEGVTDPLIAAASQNGYLPDGGDAVAGSIVPMVADLDFRDAVFDNTPPTSTGGTVTVSEDQSYSFSLADFNFADVDGHQLASIRIDTLPANGVLLLDGMAVTALDVVDAGDIDDLAFTPATNQSGVGYASFTFSVNDGIDFATAPATLTVDVTPENDAPVPVISGTSGTVLTSTDDGIAAPLLVLSSADFANPPGFAVADLLTELGITDIEQSSFGIGIIFADESQGVWQYQRPDLGQTGWTNFEAGIDPNNDNPLGVGPNQALLMDGSALLRFLPDVTFSGRTQLEFRVWDGSFGTASNPPSLIADDSGGVAPLDSSSLSAASFISGVIIGDRDGDGVDDIADLDDDNDGILDTVENAGTGAANEPKVVVGSNLYQSFDRGTFGFGSGAADESPASDPYAGVISGGTYDQFDPSVGSGVIGGIDYGEYTYISNQQTPRFSAHAGPAIDPVYGETGRFFLSDPNTDTPTLNDTIADLIPGETYQYSFWAATPDANSNQNNIDVIVDGVLAYSTGNLPTSVGSVNWQQYSFTFVAPASGQVTVALNSTETGRNGNDFYLDNIELHLCAADTDGDGIANSLDLDSDNDGISDLEESGNAAGLAFDLNNDGTVSRDEGGATGADEAGDADGDGLLDVFDADDIDISASASQGTAPRETVDGDTIADYLDLDSDGDGIADTIEARPAAGFDAGDLDATDNDADGDGVLDIFDPNDGDGDMAVFGGLFVTPINTDTVINNNADAIPDYLDTDSDGDGFIDSDESGLTPGADVNGDGIGDGTGVSYANPDGLGAGEGLADLLDNEVGDTSVLAYRELDNDPLIDLNSAATATDTNTDFSVLYTEGAALTPITNTADASDLGDADLASLTIVATPSAVVDGDSEIVSIGSVEFPLNTTLATPTTITLGSGAQVDVAYNATTGAFVITETAGGDGVITQSDMDALIQSVSYRHASVAPTEGNRTFVFTLEDVGGNTSEDATSTVTVQAVLTPPIIIPDPDGNNSVGGKYVGTFIENGNQVPIVDSDATIEDVDSSVIENATIVLTNAFPGDVLQVNIPSSISGISAMPPVVDTVNNTITIELVSSTATLSEMAQALNSVTFSTPSEDPDPTQRLFTITLTDDSGTSGGAVTVCIDVIPVNDRPVIDLDRNNSTESGDDYTGLFLEDGGPVAIVDVGDNLIADFDDLNMQSALITLTNAEVEDVLSINPGFTNPAGFTLSVMGNVVNISGDGTIAEYQQALEAVRFEATGDNPTAGERDIEVTLNDGEDNSNTANTRIIVLPLNDAPIAIDPAGDPTTPADVMPQQAGADAGQLTPFDVTPFFSDPDNAPADLTFTLGGDTPSWMSIDSNGNVVGTPPSDASQNTNVLGNTPGTYTITVIATDPGSPEIRTNPAVPVDPNDPSTGVPASAPQSGQTTVEYVISNPAPDAIDDAFLATENGADVSGNVLNANPTVADSDPDGDSIAVSAINGNAAFVGAQVAGDMGGLFRVFSSGDFVFEDNGEFEDLAVGVTRDTTITYTISDGEGGTDTASITVTVQGTNDDPTVVSPTPNQAYVDNETITLNTSTAFNDVDSADMLTYSATNLPAGLMIDETTGVISGTIDNSASQSSAGSSVQGRYRVNVFADDGQGGRVRDVIFFNISNPTPTAVDDTLSVGEDDANIVANVITALNTTGADTDPDLDELNVTRVAAGSDETALATLTDLTGVGVPVAGDNGGSFTVLADGTITFEPGADFQNLDDNETATTSIVYQIDDGEGGTDTAVMTVTVNGSNDAPEPILPNPGDDPNDFIPAQSGTDNNALSPFDVSPFFGDPDDNDTLEFTSPDAPSWLTVGTDGTITGSPPADASTGGPNNNGEYPITISVTDGDETITSVVVYSISNVPPMAEDDSYETDENTVLNVPVATGVIDSNDSDADGDPLTVTRLNGAVLVSGAPVSLTSGAIVTLNDDGSFSYDPNGAFENLADGEIGNDSFEYQIGDGDGGFATAMVEFTITGVNDAPTAVDDALNHTENAVATTGNVLAANPTDADSDPDASDVLFVSAVGGNTADVGSPVAGDAGGLFTIDSNGDLSFVDNGEFEDLALNETRITSVTYTIDDGNGGTDTATVEVTVTGVNDAPVPEIPGDPNPPVDVENYIPQIDAIDGAPIAAPLDLTQYFNDPDTNDVLVLSVDPGELPPGLTFDGTSISGTPDANASQLTNSLGAVPGTYVIPVTATDPNNGTFTTNVTLVITNTVPEAMNDDATTDEDTPFTAGNVLIADGLGSVTDTDADGDVLIVSQVAGDPTQVGQAVAGSMGGLFTINQDGSYSFDPGPDFNDLAVGEQRSTTVEYQISDNEGGLSTALVTMVVTGVNDAPEINDPANPVPLQEIADGADYSTTPLLDMDDYVTDPDTSDVVTYSTTDALPAGLTLNPDGTITGIVDPSASQGGPGGDGIYPITIIADDNNQGLTPVPLTIDVSNLAPIAVDDVSTGSEDVIQSGNLITDTGDADQAPDSDPVLVTQINGMAVVPGSSTVVELASGDLTVDADGSWSFAPNGTANALSDGDTITEVIAYQISDQQGGFSEADLTIDITGINDPVQVVDPNDPTTDPENPDYDPVDPTVIADPDNLIPDVTYSDGDTISTIPAADYFGDAEGDMITFTASDLPTGLEINETTGEITGTIDANASQEGNTLNPGEHAVTITATDPQGNMATTTVTITAQNLPIIAQDDDLATDEESSLSGSVFLANGNGADGDTPSDSDPFTVTEVNDVAADVGQPVAGSAGGLFTINGDGSYSFDVRNDFQSLSEGEELITSVRYTIDDGDGSTDTATVFVTVTGANDGPIPIDPNQPVVTDPTDPNAPPTDPDDPRAPPVDPENYIPVQMGDDSVAVTPLVLTPFFGDPDEGEVPILSVDETALPPGLTFDPTSGTISGTPTSDASQGGDPANPGTYVVAVTATDPADPTLTFTTNVTYTIENPAPIAQNDDVPADEDVPLMGSVIADNNNGADVDPDGDDIVVSRVTTGNDETALDPLANGDGIDTPVDGSNGGTFTVAGDGTYTFDPGPDFNDLPAGDTRITEVVYQIDDGQGGTDQAVISVTVLGTNDAPIPIDPTQPPIDPENPPVGTPYDPDAPFAPPADPDNYIPVQTGDDSVAVTPLVLTPFFGDPDEGEVPILSVDETALPPGLTFDPTSGTISGTPTSDASQGGDSANPGTYVVAVTATDPADPTLTFTTNVTYTIENPAPIAQNDDVPADEDVPLMGSVITDNNNGADIDPDGDDIVVSRVATGNDEAALDPLANGDGIDTPVDGSNGGTFTVAGDGSYTFDPGPDFNDLPAGDTRITEVVYQIDDGQGGTDQAVISVTVLGTNDAPIPIDPTQPPIDPENPPVGTPYDPDAPFAPPADPENYIPVQTGDDSVAVTPLVLTSFFGDPDEGEVPILSVDETALPPGLTFDPASGTISGTPTSDASQGGDPANPGTYVVAVTATDPADPTLTFTTNVTYMIVNPPPVVVVDLPDQEGTDGFDISFPTASSFDDPDGDTLTFAADGLPLGLTIDPDTGVISGTLDGNASNGGPDGDGLYPVTVTVDDGQGGMISTTFVFEAEPLLVPQTPLPPQVVDGPGDPGGPEFEPGGLSVDDAVNSFSDLGFNVGLPDDLIVTSAVNGARSLGGDMALDSEHPISEAIRNMIETDRLSGGDASIFANGNEDGDGLDAYKGLQLGVSLDIADGQYVFRTVIWQEHTYVDLQSFGNVDMANWDVRLSSGQSLPSWISMPQDGVILIEKMADVDHVHLYIEGQMRDGGSVVFPVIINLDTGEITLQGDAQTSSAGSDDTTEAGGPDAGATALLNEEIQQSAFASTNAARSLFNS